MLKENEKITFEDEPPFPGYGSAAITLTFKESTGTLASGVSFDCINGQTISDQRLLKAAAFLLKAYCTEHKIDIKDLEIRVKGTED